MVELCELKLMGNRMEGWPSSDIDQHVAQLDFDNSASIEQSLMFASIMLDPSVILSTDSLDMETLRMRCENNKNDYKLTFEDSGQWTTTSGIGASLTTTNSPPTPSKNGKRNNLQQLRRQLQEQGNNALDLGNNPEFGLRLLEELNNTEESRKIDSLLNNVSNNTANNNNNTTTMTTWGRIRSTEPFEDKTISLPELNEGAGHHYENANNLPSTMCSAPSDVLKLMTTNTVNIRYGGKSPSNTRPHSTNVFGGGLPPPPPQILPPRADKYIVTSTSCSSTTSSTATRNRPPSLLANFVENQQSRDQQYQLTSPIGANYEYTEHYLGNGRYVDLNENEIGYVPSNRAPIQRSTPNNHGELQSQPMLQNRWERQRNFAQAALTVPSTSQQQLSTSSVYKNRRTFADLSPSHTSPNLKFLTLPYKVPSFCRSSSVSLEQMLKKAQKEGIATAASECCRNNDKQLLFDSSSDGGLFKNLQNEPDSGLGSASSSGPSHIEDWPSLALLLPKNVVDACSFFKTNSSLLVGSSSAQSNPTTTTNAGVPLNNNIERNSSISKNGQLPACHNCNPSNTTTCEAAVCRTCFNVRRRRLHPPSWATTPLNLLCDCSDNCGGCCCCVAANTTTSDIVLPAAQMSGSDLSCPGLGQQLGLLSKLKLYSEEFRLIGMPIYDAKRSLVEKVVEGVAEIARGASAIVLWSALERLLADGLSEGIKPWNVIVEITVPGPATNKIFNLVKNLEASEKPENSRINHFFKEVLELHSLDGWLSYAAMKEKVLGRLYTDSAFMLRANNAYRSLFWRLIESLELLSVLTQCHQHRSPLNRANSAVQPMMGTPKPLPNWGSASRLPTDSRIPKSSSIPSRLTPENVLTQRTPIVLEEEEKLDENNSILQKAIRNREESLAVKLPSSPASVTISNAEMGRTRIPIIHYRSQSTHSPNSKNLYYGEMGTFKRPNTLPLRSRSIHSRTTPIRVARVRETEQINNMSPLEAGERLRVLSVRGEFSRCCRVNFRRGKLMNVAVPTHVLDLS